MAKTKQGREPIVDGDRDIATNGVSGNRVMAGISKTMNIGNYESIRVEFAQCKVVEDGESFEEAREKVKTDVWIEILEMIRVVEEATKK